MHVYYWFKFSSPYYYLREWEIPFSDLEVGEAIGRGRFGTVHRGSWYGDVAIRLLNVDQVDTDVDKKVLESFKLEESFHYFDYSPLREWI